jgi:diguanylate cyclase
MAEFSMPKQISGINKIFVFLASCFAGFLIIAALINYVLLFFDNLTPVTHGAISTSVLMLVVAVPLLLWVIYLQGKIGSHRREMNRLASHDRLTGLPTAGAFASMLDRKLNEWSETDKSAGAFLMVRVTVPQSAYSKYGYMANEEVISLTAAKIMSEVRSTDLVGKISPDMFAVYLSGADEKEARQIGNRMLQVSSNINVEPEKSESAFNVRVGGISFDDKLSIEDMFQKAGSQLTSSESSEPLIFSNMSGYPSAAAAI